MAPAMMAITGIRLLLSVGRILVRPIHVRVFLVPPLVREVDLLLQPAVADPVQILGRAVLPSSPNSVSGRTFLPAWVPPSPTHIWG